MIHRPYSYCVMDDVIISIAISITELYGQLSGKRVVLCITKAVKRSSLVSGKNICSLTRYAFYDTGASITNQPLLVVKKLETTNRCTYCLLWVFCHSAWVVACACN